MLKKILPVIFLFCVFSLAVNAESMPVRVETDAKLEYNKGIDYYNSGQFDEALNCFRKAIDLEPNYLDAYYNLGMTLDYLKQYDASLSIFKELLNRNPNDYEAVYRCAVVSEKLNLPEDAKFYLRKLPRSSPFYYKAQKLATKLGTDMQTIKASEPKEEEIQKTQTSKNLGNFYYQGLPSPTGIVVDKVGNLYVANFSDNLIFKITSKGDKTVYLKTPKLNGPIGLAMDESGNMYIANYNNNTVLKLTSSHELKVLIENIDKPYYLHVSNGYLYVSSQGTNTVLRYKI